MQGAKAITGLVALAAASLAAAPAMAVTPIEGVLTTEPQLVVRGVLNAGSYPSGVRSWTGTPATLDAMGDFAENLFGGSFVAQVGATAEASWASPASGSVSFEHVFTVSVTRTGVLPAGYALGSGWDYTFTPATDATFTMTYDVEAAGFGVSAPSPWEIATYNDDHYSLESDALVEGAGVYSWNLKGGETYTLELYDAGEPTYDSPVDIAGIEDSRFDWSITENSSGGGGGGPVPEPSAWTLTIAGLGLAGLGLRRRRRLQGCTA